MRDLSAPKDLKFSTIILVFSSEICKAVRICAPKFFTIILCIAKDLVLILIATTKITFDGKMR